MSAPLNTAKRAASPTPPTSSRDAKRSCASSSMTRPHTVEVIHFNSTRAALNTVTVSSDVHAKICDSLPLRQVPQHVRIAEKVFKVEVNPSLRDNSIHLHSLQATELSPFLQPTPTGDKLTLESFCTNKTKVAYLSAATFKLTQYPHATGARVKVQQQSLKKDVLSQLVTSIIHHGQTFLLQNNGITLALTVSALEASSVAGRSMGRVTAATRLILTPQDASALEIVNRVPANQIQNMVFHISFNYAAQSKHEEKRKDTTGPSVFFIEDLDVSSFIANGREISLEETIEGSLKDGTPIKARLTKVKLKDPDSKSLTRTKESKLHSSFVFHSTTPRSLYSSSDIIIATKNATEASQMTFLLTPLPSSQNRRQCWTSAEELKEALRHPDPYVCGQGLRLRTSKKVKAVLKLVNGHGRDFHDQPGKFDPSWSHSSATVLDFRTAEASGLQLVDTSTAYPAKRVSVEISQKNKRPPSCAGGPTPSILLQEKEIKRALLDILPEKFTSGDIFTLETVEHTITAKIRDVDFEDAALAEVQYGRLSSLGDAKLEFTQDKEASVDIMKEVPQYTSEELDEKIKDLNLGGLAEELKKVCEQLFAYRRYPNLAEKLGLKPVKGIIISGPPGTGKTCFARNFAEFIGTSVHKEIVANSLFNMWAGESEKNIRELFAPAKRAWERYGSKSPLFCISLDEIDALLPKRGSSVGSKWRDSVVAAFLAELDGLTQLGNIILLGTTNRLDDIDPAALRPGRMELGLTFDIPSKDARREILEIHTRELQAKGMLSEDVTIDWLLGITEDYSGAEVEGLIRKASAKALTRCSNLKIEEEEVFAAPQSKVTQEDIMEANSSLKEGKASSKVPFGMYI
jgi:ATP-dependent 26S proteasome regulatory subunit